MKKFKKLFGGRAKDNDVREKELGLQARKSVPSALNSYARSPKGQEGSARAISSQYPSSLSSIQLVNPPELIPALSDTTYYQPPPIQAFNPSMRASAATSFYPLPPRVSAATSYYPPSPGASAASSYYPPPPGASAATSYYPPPPGASAATSYYPPPPRAAVTSYYAPPPEASAVTSYYPSPPPQASKPLFGASVTTSYSSCIPGTSITQEPKPSRSSNAAPRPTVSSTKPLPVLRSFVPKNTELTNPAPNPPPLVSSDESQTTNNPYRRRAAGTAPSGETSKKPTPSAKGRGRPRDNSDSESIISIGRDESDSDSSLDADDLLAFMAASRLASVRDSLEISGPMRALMVAALISGVRRTAAEREEPSSEEKKTSGKEKEAPARRPGTKNTCQRPASPPLRPRSTIGDKAGPAKSSVPPQTEQSHSVPQKSARPPPSASQKFKVPVLAAQKGVAPTPPTPAPSAAKPPTETGRSPLADFLAARESARGRVPLRERERISTSPPSSYWPRSRPRSRRRSRSRSRSVSPLRRGIPRRTATKPVVTTSTAAATATSTTTHPLNPNHNPYRKPGPRKPPKADRKHDRDLSPTPEGISEAIKLHESRVAEFRAAAAIRRNAAQEKEREWDKGDPLPPPAWVNPWLRGQQPGSMVGGASTSAGSVEVGGKKREQTTKMGSRRGMEPPGRSTAPAQKESVKQAAGQKFRVPVLSESEKADIAAKKAAAAKPWAGWD